MAKRCNPASDVAKCVSFSAPVSDQSRLWFLKPKVRTNTFSVVERGPDDVVPEKSLCPALRLPAIVDLSTAAILYTQRISGFYFLASR